MTAAGQISRISIPRLLSRIITAKILDLNDAPRWKCQNPGSLGCVFVQWEKVSLCCPSLYCQSVTHPLTHSHTHTHCAHRQSVSLRGIKRT